MFNSSLPPSLLMDTMLRMRLVKGMALHSRFVGQVPRTSAFSQYFVVCSLVHSGGKTQAPTIHHDDEWGAILEQLARTKRGVNTVSVSFDLEILE
jgi:cytochrome c5